MKFENKATLEAVETAFKHLFSEAFEAHKPLATDWDKAMYGRSFKDGKTGERIDPRQVKIDET